MRLGWDETKRRAKTFSEEWKGSGYEQRVKLLTGKHGFIDLFRPRALLVEQKSSRLDLRKAHAALDKAVERLYHPALFTTGRDCVEHLFGRYEALDNPLERLGPAKNKRVARRSRK